MNSVARRYDLMNDLQSFGLHRRCWRGRPCEVPTESADYRERGQGDGAHAQRGVSNRRNASMSVSMESPANEREASDRAAASG